MHRCPGEVSQPLAAEYAIPDLHNGLTDRAQVL